MNLQILLHQIIVSALQLGVNIGLSRTGEKMTMLALPITSDYSV